jgi:hypothetical protein
MALRADENVELKRILEEVFQDAQIAVHPSLPSSDRRTAIPDAVVSVGNLRFWIELKNTSSGARLMDAASSIRSRASDEANWTPVLAASYLSPSSQQALRREHMAFVDLAGNAWIVGNGVHVDRRGFGSPQHEDRSSRDLFSDKASLVLRVLMKEQSPLGVRQIAEIVSSKGGDNRLTPGYVSKVISELARRGYVRKVGEKVVLRRAAELLNDWVIDLRKRRRPAPQNYFMPASDAESLMPRIAEAFDQAGVEYVFAGHAGASLVDRHAMFDSLSLYAKDEGSAHDVLVGLGARLVDRGANISVSKPYYRVAAFYDYQVPKDHMKAASDVQLYLDLYDYPVRGREQAEHLYEARLRPTLERQGEL